MLKIAILYICTGKYDVFWKEFYRSCEQYFLPNSNKNYFVFTDSKELYDEKNNDKIVKIYQEKLGWPYDTLMRFDLFSRIENKLAEFDYIFFLNANVVFLKTVEESSLFNNDNDLFVVIHPGWIKRNKYLLPYERDRKSKAYIPFGKGDKYFMGGFNGGTSKAYLKLINTLKCNVQIDLENNIIAKWHDESHLNKYMLECEDYKILPPSFGYPENWILPYEPIVLIRDKDKVFNTSNVKGYKTRWVQFKKKIRRCLNRLFHR